jgi:hypothetical protein
MPERRMFRGRLVRSARRIMSNGMPYIKITFEGQRGKRGPQLVVRIEEYDREVQRTFVKSSESD